MLKILNGVKLSVKWKKEDSSITATKEVFMDIPWLEQYTKDIKEHELIDIRVEPTWR